MVQEKMSVDRPTGGDTPLRHFKGILDELKLDQRVANDGRTYAVALFNFTNLEVLESTEPFPFPIAQIGISYKPPAKSRGGTKWEAFAASLRKLMPTNPDPDNLKGKAQEWKQLERPLRSALTDEEGMPVKDGNDKQIWGEVPTLCWTVVSVEGIGSVEEKGAELNDFLIDLADGKTDAKFHEAALTHSKVTGNSDMVQQLVDRKWLPVVMEMGKLTRDAEGILHKVTGTTPATEATVEEPST